MGKGIYLDEGVLGSLGTSEAAFEDPRLELEPLSWFSLAPR